MEAVNHILAFFAMVVGIAKSHAGHLPVVQPIAPVCISQVVTATTQHE